MSKRRESASSFAHCRLKAENIMPDDNSDDAKQRDLIRFLLSQKPDPSETYIVPEAGGVARVDMVARPASPISPGRLSRARTCHLPAIAPARRRALRLVLAVL
jgi:hypothetical protein